MAATLVVLLHFLCLLFSSNHIPPTLLYICLDCSITFIEDANLMEDAIVLYFLMNLILIRTWIFAALFVMDLLIGPRQLSYRRIFYHLACIDDRGTKEVQVVILKMYKKILWIKSARIVFSLLILSHKQNNDIYGILMSEEEILKCETLSELDQNYELPDGQLKGETSFELEQNYELLDGKFITIDSERFQVFELIVLLVDEVLGSGISLFIKTNICKEAFYRKNLSNRTNLMVNCALSMGRRFIAHIRMISILLYRICFNKFHKL